MTAGELLGRAPRAWKADRFLGRTLRPGDAAQVDLKVSETVTHQPARIPVRIVRGQGPGPTVCITSAIHGDEVNGVAIVRRLLVDLERHLAAGAVVAVPVANRFGFDAGERYLPDRRDLNRHFPGDRHGSMAARIADRLFRKVVLQCDAAIDLHTAPQGHSNLCHIRGDADRGPVRQVMRAFGTPIMVHGDGPRGSLRRAATEAGVPSILYEAGEPGRFQRHAVDIGLTGILRLLSRLGMVERRFRKPPLQVLVRNADWTRSDHGGILELAVEPGDLVRSGQALGAIYDPYGRHVDHVKAGHSGVVLGVAMTPLVFPGMALVHIGRLDKTYASAARYVADGGDLGHLNWTGHVAPKARRKAAPARA